VGWARTSSAVAAGYPSASPPELALLGRMLCFSQRKRIAVDDALRSECDDERAAPPCQPMPCQD
jgi:hypothetical protein